MKTLLTLALFASAITGFGQTSTNLPPSTNFSLGLGPQADQVLGFLSQGSNFMIAPYGIYSTGTRSAGGGLALAYHASEFIVPMFRIDGLSATSPTTGKRSFQFYLPSGSIQLQLPVQVSKLTLIPFVVGGVATPIGGSQSMNGSVVGIAGAGAAVRLSKRFDVVADAEKWVGLPGMQYRFGLLYKF